MTDRVDFTGCPRVQGRAYIVAEVPCLTDLQREFYRVYLDARRGALFVGERQ